MRSRGISGRRERVEQVFHKHGVARSPFGIVSIPIGSGMSRFYFDLVIDCRVLSDLGGMSFRYAESAKSVADKLARHLALRRSDLCSRGNCVRVRDGHGEIHRSPIDAGPAVYKH